MSRKNARKNGRVGDGKIDRKDRGMLKAFATRVRGCDPRGGRGRFCKSGASYFLAARFLDAAIFWWQFLNLNPNLNLNLAPNFNPSESPPDLPGDEGD
jgi:hypothetical protein